MINRQSARNAQMNVCQKMKPAVAILLVTMLYGCGAVTLQEKKQSVSSADKWVGHTVDELIVANGEPVSVYRSESGGRVFEYFKDSSSNKTQVRTFKKANPNKSGGKASDSSLPCKILFTISASDVVESWSAEGDKCN